jgi:hypothetical protein
MTCCYQKQNPVPAIITRSLTSAQKTKFDGTKLPVVALRGRHTTCCGNPAFPGFHLHKISHEIDPNPPKSTSDSVRFQLHRNRPSPTAAYVIQQRSIFCSNCAISIVLGLQDDNSHSATKERDANAQKESLGAGRALLWYASLIAFIKEYRRGF